MLKVISLVIIGISLTIAGWFGYQEPVAIETPSEQILSGFSPAGGLTYRTQTSIGTTDASIKLSSFKNRSDIALTMTILNTDIGYGTLSPQTTRSEFISFTGITQNSDGTATLTGVIRGLSDISPFTASTTLREPHPGQSIFILSDSPQLFEEYAKLRGYNTITGNYGFTNAPTSTDACNAAGELCDYTYVNALAFQGVATSTEDAIGAVRLATMSQAAAGTASSTSGAPLVLLSRYATSTPGITNWNVLPITNTSGKLNQSFWDLTQSFAWSGVQNLTGTTYIKNLNASSTAANPIYLNGIDYNFPATEGASSTVMMTNGSGAITWNNPDWQLLGEFASSSVSATITASGLPVRKFLRVYFYSQGGSTDNSIAMVFNGDTGNNYGTRNAQNFTVQIGGATHSNGPSIMLTSGIINASSTFATFDIFNYATSTASSPPKYVHWTGLTSYKANSPTEFSGVGTWNNPVPINRIEFKVNTGTFLADSFIQVYGSNN